MCSRLVIDFLISQSHIRFLLLIDLLRVCLVFFKVFASKNLFQANMPPSHKNNLVFPFIFSQVMEVSRASVTDFLCSPRGSSLIPISSLCRVCWSRPSSSWRIPDENRRWVFVTVTCTFTANTLTRFLLCSHRCIEERKNHSGCQSVYFWHGDGSGLL